MTMHMKMSAAPEYTDQSELERIEHWRADELMRGGYGAEQALALAVRHDVDLHGAIALLERGCSPELALKILL
jgi:hypothetical protein